MNVNWLARFSAPLVAVIMVLCAFQFLVVDRAVVNLQIHTDNRTLFKIYYSGENGNWSERKSATILITPDRQNYSFRLADLRRISKLRIDTCEKPATVTIHSLILNQWGYAPVRIAGKKQFERLQPANDIGELAIQQGGITVRPGGRDPFLIYKLDPLVDRGLMLGNLVRLVCIAGLTILAFKLFSGSGERYRFVVWLLCIVLGLVAAMASLSLYNQHPDEWVHIEAAKYYQFHLMPPRVASPEIEKTYTRYGVSRLDSGEIAYFLAGTFSRLLLPLQLPSYLCLRLFNVMLFALLCIFAARQVVFRILMLPLLLSPQIWYIFTYFNSEAFALFVILLIAYQMVVEDSAWNRMLTAPRGRWPVMTIAGLGILLGLLLLCKMNFYFFGLFLFFYFLWRLWLKKTVLNVQLFYRMAMVVLVGFSLFGAVRFAQDYVNDFDKAGKIYAARDVFADHMFKPSTPLEKKFYLLQMKERGVSLRYIIDNGRWGEKSFRSSFGEYGYMSVAASFGYYDLVRYSGLALLGLVVRSLLWYSGRGEAISLLLITLGCAVGLMGVALYHAWTVDFQAQGRYFLPIVGMVSIFFYHLRERFSHPLMVAGFSAIFLLSLYSFLLVGLSGIAKISMTVI